MACTVQKSKSKPKNDPCNGRQQRQSDQEVEREKNEKESESEREWKRDGKRRNVKWNDSNCWNWRTQWNHMEWNKIANNNWGIDEEHVRLANRVEHT